MVPSVIFGVVFLWLLSAFLMTARIVPDRRRQALGGAVIVFWFGLLFFSSMFPETIYKLIPWLSENIWHTMIIGLPMMWGIYTTGSRVLPPEVTWKQAFLSSPSMIASVLIVALFFLNAYEVLDGPQFTYACLMAMSAMGLLVVGTMVWRKKHPEYPNLYQKIVNEPESAQKTAVKYPPAAGGIEVKSLVEILAGHKELLKNLNKATETDVFEKRYWPVIERYAQLVHLLPASENDHHRDVGGLLHHGLEVGYLTMTFGKFSMYGKEWGSKKQAARERWLFACFAAGLCHDLGKVADDVRVATDNGLVWSPDAARLMEWAAKNQVKKYYVDRQADRHKVHESFTASMLGKVLTDEDKEYISEIDRELSKQIMMALTPSSGVEGSSIRPYNIREMVLKADQESVIEDKKKSRTPADLGLERPTPLIRHYHDGIQRLLQNGRWKINETGAAAWVMGPDRGLYLVWPRCGMELYESLWDEGVKGSPAAPEVIADILAENDLLVPAAPGDYYWRIKPAGIDGPALTVLRINSKFAPNFVNPFPASLGGLVQTDEGESSWKYVEAGPPDLAVVSSSEKIIPLHTNSGARMEIPDHDRIIREPVQGYPGPKGAEAPIEFPVGCKAESVSSGHLQAIADENGARFGLSAIVKAFITGFAMCFMFGLTYLVHRGHEYYQEYPFWTYLKLLIYDIFKEQTILQLGLYTILFLWGLAVYPIVKRIHKKAADIQIEAKELRDEAEAKFQEAKQETLKILADARREGSEIKKAATAEAADIRLKGKAEAKQEADKEKERIIQEAKAEADKLLESTKNEAQEKKDQAKEYTDLLWSGLESKAIKEGVPPEKLPEMVKAKNQADKEAKEIKERAEAEGEAIKAEARAKAEAEVAVIKSKIQARAEKDAEEHVIKARIQAADILDDAIAEADRIRKGQPHEKLQQEGGKIEDQGQEQGQSNDDHSIQEDPEEETAGEEDMDILGQIADQTDAFIADRCVMGSEISIRASDFYQTYLYWAEENGVQNPVSQRSFGGILRRRGFVRVKTNKANIWRGIGLRSTVGEPYQPSTIVE